MTPANTRAGAASGDIVLTLLASEHVRLPCGREFRGMNAETDAARALIAAGEPENGFVQAVWCHGTPSYRMAIGALARKRFSDDGTQRWRPHPRAVLPPLLAAWWEREQAAHVAKRQAAAEGQA